MKSYERVELKITEFEKEDIISTSAVPGRNYKMVSPNYSSGSSSGSPIKFGTDWTPWV